MIDWVKVILADIFHKNYVAKHESKLDEVLEEVIEWLLRAQKYSNTGGFSCVYAILYGWRKPYRETTGYIIPTLLTYSELTNKERFFESAKKGGDWLLTAQNEDGGISGIDTEKSLIFDTGMVIFGLISLYEKTRNDHYLYSALRAGEFLRNAFEKEQYKEYGYRGRFHSYYSRVCWALIELGKVSGKKQYIDIAEKILREVLSRQKENGWFKDATIATEIYPYTHAIAYTIRGFLESAFILGSDEYFLAAQRGAEKLLERYEITGRLSAQYDDAWNEKANYICVPGCAQISIIWQKFYKYTSDYRYLNSALKLNSYLRSLVNTKSDNPGIKGGVKNSHPIWGEYLRFCFPNWGAKFLADALMLEKGIYNKLPG